MLTIVALAGFVAALIAIIMRAANPSIQYTALQIQPARHPEKWRTDAIKIAVGSYVQGTVMGKVSTTTANNDVQTITISGSPTGGTFILQFGGYNTTALAYNISTANMATALAALPSIGSSSNVTVTGTAGSSYTVTFTGACGNLYQSLISLYSNSLTGGSSPSVSIAHTTPGNSANGSWRPYNSGNSDGSQIPKCVLIFAGTVDTFGNHVFGGGEWNQPGSFGDQTAPAVFGGYVKTIELTGLDSNACSPSVSGWRIADGSVANIATDPGTILELV